MERTNKLSIALGPIVLAGVALALLVVPAGRALAACAPGPTVEQMIRHPARFGDYDSAFIGTPTLIRHSVESSLGRDQQPAVFTPVVLRVEAVLHGSMPHRVLVMDVGGRIPGEKVGVGGEGTVGFRIGKEYLFVGRHNPDGTYSTDECAGTFPIDDRAARSLTRLAGGPDATRPGPGPEVLPDPSATSRPGGGGAGTLTILLAFLAGAGLSTALVLARRRLTANRR
jgi:hypothetical protein